ncbi:MAG TPA: MFS transporter [Solirubrobacteraceae bacterium]|nr:MFS transporter [Solirubrobacteraceae bacterium]
MRENRWWTLAAVCTATFMLLLDITIVNVALPELRTDLEASFSDLQWVVDAYALALAAFLLLAGSLGDRIGRRRVFTAGLVVFVVASILCGISRSPTALNVSRALQGVGGSAMFATALALIAQAFPVGRERATAIGAWGATIGAAVAVGPLVGGLCTEHLGWESIFFLNVPIGAFAVFITLRFVAESKDQRTRSIDWLGAATFSAALFLLVFALVRGNEEGWGSGLIVFCLLESLAFLLAFVAIELRVKDPTFDLALFRNRSFNGVSIAAFGLSAAMFAMFLYLTLYIQNQLGYSPLEAGLRFLPTTLVSFAVAPVTARLAEGGPARVFFGIGLALVGLGLLLMRNVTPESDWTALLPGFIVAGAGVGCTNPIIASVAVGVVEPREAGMASGINSTFRQVGIATGIAGLGAVFQSRLASGVAGDAPDEGAYLASIPLSRVPPELRDAVHAGFVGALDDILLIAALVAFASAAATVALVRA